MTTTNTESTEADQQSADTEFVEVELPQGHCARCGLPMVRGFDDIRGFGVRPYLLCSNGYCPQHGIKCKVVKMKLELIHD